MKVYPRVFLVYGFIQAEQNLQQLQITNYLEELNYVITNTQIRQILNFNKKQQVNDDDNIYYSYYENGQRIYKQFEVIQEEDLIYLQKETVLEQKFQDESQNIYRQENFYMLPVMIKQLIRQTQSQQQLDDDQKTKQIKYALEQPVPSCSEREISKFDINPQNNNQHSVDFINEVQTNDEGDHDHGFNYQKNKMEEQYKQNQDQANNKQSQYPISEINNRTNFYSEKPDMQEILMEVQEDHPKLYELFHHILGQIKSLKQKNNKLENQLKTMILSNSAILPEDEQNDVIKPFPPLEVQSRLDLAILFSHPLVIHSQQQQGKSKQIQVVRTSAGQPVNYEDEIRRIKGFLEQSRQKIFLETDNATIDQLQTMILQKPVMLHISCHGDYDKNSQKYVLIFEDERGRVHKVERQHILNCFQNLKAKDFIQLVFVNACQSQDVASVFYEADVPFVICVKKDFKIEDKSAEIFSNRFYQYILSGQTVYTSFEKAKEVCQTERGHICCCGHGHKENCQWLQYFYNHGSNDAHLEHDPTCLCPQLGENKHKNTVHGPCEWTAKFLENFSYMEEKELKYYIERNQTLYACCCGVERDPETDEFKVVQKHDETEKFQLLTKHEEQAKKTILFEQLPSGQLIDNSHQRYSNNLKFDRRIFGYQMLVQEIFEHLTFHPETRIITLQGQIGSGQTAYARAAALYAEERGYYCGQGRIILADIDKISNIRTVVKNLIGQSYSIENYCRYNRDKDVLLIIDNCDKSYSESQNEFQDKINYFINNTQRLQIILTINKLISMGFEKEKVIQVGQIDKKSAQQFLTHLSGNKIKYIQNIDKILDAYFNDDYPQRRLPKNIINLHKTNLNDLIDGIIRPFPGLYDFSTITEGEKMDKEIIENLHTNKIQQYTLLLIISMFPNGLNFTDLQIMQMLGKIPENWMSILYTMCHEGHELNWEILKSSQNQQNFPENQYEWFRITQTNDKETLIQCKQYVVQALKENFVSQYTEMQNFVFQYIAALSETMIEVYQESEQRPQFIVDYCATSMSGVISQKTVQEMIQQQNEVLCISKLNRTHLHEVLKQYVLITDFSTIYNHYELGCFTEDQQMSFLMKKIGNQKKQNINNIIWSFTLEKYDNEKEIEELKSIIEKLSLFIPTLLFQVCYVDCQEQICSQAIDAINKFINLVHCSQSLQMLRDKMSTAVVVQYQLLFFHIFLLFEKSYNSESDKQDNFNKLVDFFQETEKELNLILEQNNAENEQQNIEKEFLKSNEFICQLGFSETISVSDAYNHYFLESQQIIQENVRAKILEEGKDQLLSLDNLDIFQGKISIQKAKILNVPQIEEIDIQQEVGLLKVSLENAMKVFEQQQLNHLYIQTVLQISKLSYNHVQRNQKEIKKNSSSTQSSDIIYLTKLQNNQLETALHFSKTIQDKKLESQCRTTIQDITSLLRLFKSNFFEFMRSSPLLPQTSGARSQNNSQNPRNSISTSSSENQSDPKNDNINSKYLDTVRFTSFFKQNICDTIQQTNQEVTVKFELLTQNNFKNVMQQGCSCLFMDLYIEEEKRIIVEDDDLPIAREYTFNEITQNMTEHPEELGDIELLIIGAKDGLKIAEMIEKTYAEINQKIMKNQQERLAYFYQSSTQRETETQLKPQQQNLTRKNSENSSKSIESQQKTPSSYSNSSSSGIDQNSKDKTQNQKQTPVIITFQLKTSNPKVPNQFAFDYIQRMYIQYFVEEILYYLLDSHQLQDAFDRAKQNSFQLIQKLTGGLIKNFPTFKEYFGEGAILISNDPQAQIYSHINRGDFQDISSVKVPTNLVKKYNYTPFIIPNKIYFPQYSRFISFVGRNQEIKNIIKLIQTHSINIYGDSGVGKSELVYQAAYVAYNRNLFQDGIFYFDLSELKNYNNDLGKLMSKDLDSNFHQRISVYFRDRQMLLVFDNFENIKIQQKSQGKSSKGVNDITVEYPINYYHILDSILTNDIKLIIVTNNMIEEQTISGLTSKYSTNGDQIIKPYRISNLSLQEFNNYIESYIHLDKINLEDLEIPVRDIPEIYQNSQNGNLQKLKHLLQQQYGQRRPPEENPNARILPQQDFQKPSSMEFSYHSNNSGANLEFSNFHIPLSRTTSDSQGSRLPTLSLHQHYSASPTIHNSNSQRIPRNPISATYIHDEPESSHVPGQMYSQTQIPESNPTLIRNLSVHSHIQRETSFRVNKNLQRDNSNLISNFSDNPKSSSHQKRNSVDNINPNDQHNLNIQSSHSFQTEDQPIQKVPQSPSYEFDGTDNPQRDINLEQPRQINSTPGRDQSQTIDNKPQKNSFIQDHSKRKSEVQLNNYLQNGTKKDFIENLQFQDTSQDLDEDYFHLEKPLNLDLNDGNMEEDLQMQSDDNEEIDDSNSSSFKKSDLKRSTSSISSIQQNLSKSGNQSDEALDSNSNDNENEYYQQSDEEEEEEEEDEEGQEHHHHSEMFQSSLSGRGGSFSNFDHFPRNNKQRTNESEHIKPNPIENKNSFESNDSPESFEKKKPKRIRSSGSLSKSEDLDQMSHMSLSNLSLQKQNSKYSTNSNDSVKRNVGAANKPKNQTQKSQKDQLFGEKKTKRNQKQKNEEDIDPDSQNNNNNCKDSSTNQNVQQKQHNVYKKKNKNLFDPSGQKFQESQEIQESRNNQFQTNQHFDGDSTQIIKEVQELKSDDEDFNSQISKRNQYDNSQSIDQNLDSDSNKSEDELNSSFLDEDQFIKNLFVY